MKNSQCADCGKTRKRGMVFDWVSKQWFCARCFKTLLKDYRRTKPCRRSAK